MFSRIEENINRTTTFLKRVYNLTPEVKDYYYQYMYIRYFENIVEKRRNFSTIFCYLLLELHV